MQRRPLCLAALLLVIVLWMLPKDIWLKEPDISSGELTVITGTVVKREQKEDRQVCYIKKCQSDLTDSEFSILAYMPEGESYPIGCKISIYGTIYQLNKADNPGQFDGESYYQSQGILYTFQTEEVISFRGEDFFREKITRFREYLGRKISEIYEERDAGILKAVLLGDKSCLREEDEVLYQKNGIAHLLAISGLHISLIGISLYRLLRKCHLTFIEAGIPSGMLLLAYGIMTGFGISTIRAVSMFLVMIFGDIAGKAYDMASAMALAAILILVKNPLQAGQAGFLLSFGAVLGICAVYPVLQSVIETKRKYVKTVLFSISISLVTYPLTVHFFYEYPLYSALLNFIVIPCMPVVMIFGAAGIFGGCLSASFGRLLGLPAHMVLSFFEFLGHFTEKLPLSVIRPGREDLWQLAAYYSILVFVLVFLWYERKKIFCVFLPAAVILVTLRFRGNLQITMLDVGQGDGIFLRFPCGTTCFIDGGSTSVKNVGEYRILPYLKYEGVSKLDYVIFSHLDEDHMNGVRELLERDYGQNGVSFGTMLFPDVGNPDDQYNQLWSLVEECGIDVERIGAGDILCGENWEIVCMFPKKESQSGDKNNHSTVLQLKYGEFSMLFTGDMGFEGEAELLGANRLCDIDVWKVSHHGSKYSGSEKFLECIRPNVSLISVGRNTYGHPSKELLGRLTEIGSQVWATVDTGAIMLESDGKSYSIALQRRGD